jgi:hypothetical protein
MQTQEFMVFWWSPEAKRFFASARSAVPALRPTEALEEVLPTSPVKRWMVLSLNSGIAYVYDIEPPTGRRIVYVGKPGADLPPLRMSGGEGRG